MEVFRKGKPINKRRVLFVICCCILPVINWLIFYVFANLSSFVMAFTNKDGVLSFDNFIRFWDELTNPASDIRIAFRNTFLTFAIVLVSFPFKVLVSYFIYKKIPLAGVYRILFFLPSIIFSVALAMIFQKIISVNGFIAEWVQDWLNLATPPELLADSRYANTVVLLHMMWLSFPGDLIIWGGTFTRIPNDVLESGQIDGVNWWQEFTLITVPMVWPTVALQMVLMFCGIFGASGAVFLLTKGMYGTMTLSAWMYLQLLNMSGNQYTSNAYNYMSAVGLVITVIAIAISLGIRKWTDKAFEEVEF
ncbi:MAG: sugar ABC transporter permease [Tyzzerella sp.]|nr:sugar ABC transporter permease [Tyzzerella sp.]